MTRDPFLNAVIAAPDDDLPRLVYADWLDERGDPRGEFIRLQIDAARDSQPSVVREQSIRALLEKHAFEWIGPLADIISGYIFRRGFIDEITLVAEQYLRHESTIFAAIPVRKIKFRGVLTHERALAKSTGLARLDAIDLGYNDLQPDDLRRVFESPHLTRVRDLTIAGNPVGDDGASAIAYRRDLTNLVRLDVEGCRITQRGAMLLQLATHLRALDQFVCFDNDLGNTGVQLILEMPAARRWNELDLSETKIDDDGAAIVAAGNWPNLERLDLHYNRIGRTGLMAIGGSIGLARLDYLGLHGNPFTETDLSDFLETPVGSGLTALGYNREMASPELSSALSERFEDRVY